MWMKSNKVVEFLAVVLNLLYTILYLNGSVWCYLFGVLGPLMLLVLCWRNKLYAEPVLQLFYTGFAVYGWLGAETNWTMVHWPFSRHIPFIFAGLILAGVAGFLLKRKTDAKLPYLDSVVTVFGVIGTWIMVNYVHENWLYFIGINAISIYIYTKRKLFFGAAMFLIYLLMAIDGYFQFNLFTI
jgi:nicotinamide mononucleotide transporter